MDKTKLKELLIGNRTSIKQAIKKLNETGERILFVVDKQEKLLGTVTDGDIRREIIKGLGFGVSVENTMSQAFISVRSDYPDAEERAKQLMIENKIERIPVLDDEGKIIDVILWIDILGGEKQLSPRQQYPNQVVIMAGGKGARLDPFTRILPKPLIPIGNKPVIQLIMDKFYESGFSEFIYTLNYKKEYIKLYLRENDFPYNIDWIEEEDLLGTAGGLSLLKDKVTETFFVCNCDSLLDVNYADILKWHKEHEAVITVVGCHNEVNIPFGVLQVSNGRLDRILEKPVHDVIINTGVYVMEPYVLSLIPEGKHKDMDQLIDLIVEKEKITVYPIYEGWLDVGKWEDYKKNVNHLKGLSVDEE